MKTDITPNLQLLRISEYDSTHDTLISVSCHFQFYGKHGRADIDISNLEKEYPSYSYSEIDSDLGDSFESQLEDHWEEISKQVQIYHTEWEAKIANLQS